MSHYSFEDLDVWQRAVEFANEVISVVDKLNTDRKHFRVIEQLESAVTSIAMNIAEGKGRFSKKEFIQFLYIARGSLFETITLMEIFKKRDWLNNAQYNSLRNEGDEIGKMLSSLINSLKSMSHQP
jgi:four helix bundle protein